MNTNLAFLVACITMQLSACSTTGPAPDLTKEIGSKKAANDLLTIVYPVPEAPLCLTGTTLHRCGQQPEQ